MPFASYLFNGYIDHAKTAVKADANVLAKSVRLFTHGFVKGCRQRLFEILSDHVQDMKAGFARGRRQVSVRFTHKVLNLILRIDQNTGRRIFSNDGRFSHCLDRAYYRQLILLFGFGYLPDAVMVLSGICDGRAHNPFFAFKDLPFGIAGFEKIRVVTDAFGCSQKQNPAGD